MKIHNVRLGLATNSSSSHSLIFLPNTDDNHHGTGFGWENFTLSSPESKMDYLGAAIYENLRRETGDDVAITVAREWSGSRAIDKESYIDHESHMTLPRNWDGKGLNREFIEDFKQFLNKDGVVILGGNDNFDDNYNGHPLRNSGIDLGGATPIEDYSPWIARHDPIGYWVLFNRATGAKLRVTFSEKGLAATPERSTYPELVDVKITDRCYFDCKFCYQDSTKDGKHADEDVLNSMAYLFGDLSVFEVAIGGGEPTIHHHLEEFLQTLKYQGVVANMTTKNLTWIKAEAREMFDKGLLGAIAYSAETDKDVEKLNTIVGKWSDKADRINIQHVIGIHDDEFRYQYFLNECAKSELRLTLLGYKMVGRGPSFGEKKNAKWLEILAKTCKDKNLRVGIDTVLADKHWDALIAAGVPTWCMTRYEGKFSCYVDAVNTRMAPSSYCDKDKYRLLTRDRDKFVTTYQSFSN